jgi:hypothetical protein
MKIDTPARKFKLSTLALLFVLFCLYAIFIDIKNYFYFAILVVFILYGVNAIIDYVLGLPMQVDYSRVLYPKKENKTGRFIGLLLGCAMVAFGFWWIICKPI